MVNKPIDANVVTVDEIKDLKTRFDGLKEHL